MKYSNSVLYSSPFKPTKKPEEKKRQLPAWIETIEKQPGWRSLVESANV